MADPEWLYLERSAGRVRRVTVLDRELRVLSKHERGSDWFEPDDCQLVRAVQLSESLEAEAS
jgi:hypothetical protein